MEYTKENINGVVFISNANKYTVVYPGKKGVECDLLHHSDGIIKSWDSISAFNRHVDSKQFLIVEQPSLYPIF